MALSGARAAGWWPSRGERTARLVALALVVLSLAAPRALRAQLHGQHWDVTVEGSGRARVGDPVTIVFRVRLDERDLLFDTIPRPAAATPGWVRVISVEKLQRQPDRIFTGRARVAFYRPGRQPVPVFELPFMRSVKGLSRGTLSSDSASVEIVPVVTDASSATLRDIKEPAGLRSPDPLELLLGLAALAAAGWLAWRSRRRLPVAIPVSTAAEELPASPDPYETALDRLAIVEGAGWATVDVARHYDAVADVLRDYLEAHGVPARERTTAELRWALPPALLAGGSPRRFEQVFEEADLVKFAHWRPDGRTAVAFLAAARELLARWQAVHAGEQVGRGAER